MHQRLLVAIVVAALSVVALGGAVLASGSPGFGTPGTTTFKDLNANAQLSDSNGISLFLSVDRGVQTFKLRGAAGPPVMVGPETVLNYFGSSPDGTTLFVGCFVIPDSAFTVASGLSTATLKVDPSIETPCPGFLVSAGSGGRPGVAQAAPDGGGGGGGGGQPITADLVWTSNGAVSTSSGTSSTRCQAAVAHGVGSSTSTFASVSGSVSVLADVTTQFAIVSTFSTTEVTTASFSNACLGI
ncbi:MAG TPA: hypothetical protein VFO75_01990 [Candidatus Dormibacteraeota bacterium]|nr:hypothetical protein [Candidatus Dormibacteraeota bacterium]